MYFSLITPSPGNERDAVHQRLDGPYADHQWLWNWFPAENGAPRDFLFRRHETDGAARFYVVSHRPPIEEMGAWHARTRDYAPQVAEGDRLQFELRANPTVRHGRDGKSKRHDVVMEAKKKMLIDQGLARWVDWTSDEKPMVQDLVQAACTAWLERRAERLGFVPDRETLLIESYEQHREKPDQLLTFSTVDLTGQLTVSDPEAFNAALLSGVGSAKAFGCGLLLVRRFG